MTDQIKTYTSTAKVIGITSIGLLFAGFVIYTRGKNKGKDDERVKIVPAPLPVVDPAKGISEDVSKRVRAYALTLHEDLVEFWGARDIALYNRLAVENDVILISVYNDFNELYGKDKNGTLTKWLQDEIMHSLSMKLIVKRFQGLNLK